MPRGRADRQGGAAADLSRVLGQWSQLGEVAGNAALMYLTALVGLRLGERRTLAQGMVIDFATVVANAAIVGGWAALAEGQSILIGSHRGSGLVDLDRHAPAGEGAAVPPDVRQARLTTGFGCWSSTAR